MPKQLLVIAGPDTGCVFPLPEGDTLLIGRSRATQTRLSDPHVSRVHCQVQVDGDVVILSDYESAGGTLVNGKRIIQCQLRPTDVIQIGQTQLRYCDDEHSTVVEAVKYAPAASAQLTDLIGKKVSHYQIGSVLAQGQTGLVFHARDLDKDRPVALKVLWPRFAQNDKQRQRFIRAMKTMLPVPHPNLVALYGAGKVQGYCWLAMEYVEGENLTQVIQRIGTAGMLDWRHALRYAVHIGRGLDFAHQLSIIHRNITPMNILIQVRTKVAKLGDLMLAKALAEEHGEPITGPGDLVGDVRFMAPERTRDTASVDGRSDLYSLGATLYTLLTGRPPFDRPTLKETLDQIREAEPARPKKYHLAVPDVLEGVVLRALAKRPEDRYQTAVEFLVDLDRVARLHGFVVDCLP